MLTILYGILGLGLIVLIHETGHLIAARMCGVKVEAFSVGMGPILLHKTIKDTDYRLSLIPLGGYCEMKGEKAFSEALESNAKEITGEPDSLYGVHPLKRAFIAFMGPFFNVIFAFFAFIISLILQVHSLFFCCFSSFFPRRFNKYPPVKRGVFQFRA